MSGQLDAGEDEELRLDDEEEHTWQMHEITGHLMLDSSDDGTGINGVGFRPTTAQAAMRTRKRAQQVAEWRAREAREARQVRGARRRGEGVLPMAVVSETEKKKREGRIVRFA